ncbi:related to isoamyl alcohol oxidase [Fusarium fujikuroi]|uniref:FAD-linked oxidoreductase apf9 n=2 Tax=Fusarium fujikuroi TaxID=5127 RepID=APF9_GIBF5|nr:related to isoamyl alcohol oxidase [Fusarium fujikuroi IMI 58289]S0DL65.1 RecName: Full=FAD-linked oxidoreductase apf9; AltName: Full=Apicidin F synthesis protein 9; Flags: Precursor [Fusarium fujikuroi IMI 58289]KLO98496.1 isoamyl alcohol oxidase [Fusarium fujikuroi]KLP14991.1 isoamyl alcohol oxidase [Fusarium fujikuroi]QGI59808.1 hypothetical protein CEK27_001933 [Fusarium fujikuroi]QGI77010.1 hypothetical protein CEK25_001916 [Fusarium fujikuroi]QGI90721.1 hypothetical protein CEK26_001
MKPHTVSLVLSNLASLAAATCKCTPGHACWPSLEEWSRFNSSIGGQLIQSSPVAEACYSGPKDNAACQNIEKSWTDDVFQVSQPIGYAWPLNLSCPLPTPGLDTKCSIGNSPVYVVNVTCEEDITRGIKFAQEKNLRLVVKSTGHDSQQRSTGYGSLSIWLHNFRKGFRFQGHNPVLATCPKSGWKGSTLTINGGYSWRDIYPAAQKQGLIVIGGLDRGPCSTGGWTQGGGHSPGTHYFGIGADQVLSARVVLASGKIVVASPCENEDLFFAIRGGGGGTFGVVTEITVKTYPTKALSTINLIVGSKGDETVPKFLDAVATIYSLLPGLSKKGFAGYGNWVVRALSPITAKNYTNLYGQSWTLLGATQQEAENLFQPFKEEIVKHQSENGLEVTVSSGTFRDYFSYYYSMGNGTDSAVGGVSALASRLLDTEALQGNRKDLRKFLDSITQGSAVYHTLIHHGLEAAADVKADPTSAVLPGWYKSILLDEFEIPMNTTDVDAYAGSFEYLRNELVPLYESLSPDTGTYMNEADWGNMNWKKDFFGSHWDRLLKVKTRYDPEGFFYCPKCVGSDDWVENKGGSLCRA